MHRCNKSRRNLKEETMKLTRFKTMGMAVASATLLMAAVVYVAVVYVAPMARERRQNVALGRQWADLLTKHATFSGRQPYPNADVTFTYAAATDQNLARLRKLYDLDTIAGQGPEVERIVNLARWVFQLTGHANEPEIPKELNAFNLIHLAKDEHMQINCYMKTIILNEVYLATGWPSRQTHLLPSEKEEEASHFTTSVYARSLGKWIMMDPDLGAYMTDEKGTILGVAEIRSRMIAGRPLRVKDLVDAGRLESARNDWSNFTRGVDYLWFLSDFLFKIQCPKRSVFNQASEPKRVMIELIPDGYREELLQEPRTDERGRKIISINDQGLFWQKPSGE
jgi:hypothetical protein